MTAKTQVKGRRQGVDNLASYHLVIGRASIQKRCVPGVLPSTLPCGSRRVCPLTDRFTPPSASELLAGELGAGEDGTGSFS